MVLEFIKGVIEGVSGYETEYKGKAESESVEKVIVKEYCPFENVKEPGCFADFSYLHCTVDVDFEGTMKDDFCYIIPVNPSLEDENVINYLVVSSQCKLGDVEFKLI